jgi:hypothetical protein
MVADKVDSPPGNQGSVAPGRLFYFLERIVFAVAAALAYSGVAVVVFRLWISEATVDARKPQPIGFAVTLCLLVMVALALVRRDRFRSTFAGGVLGLCFGFLLYPTASMIPEKQLELIRGGEFAWFAPFALCVSAFVGTIVGQSVCEIRRVLNHLNSSTAINWSRRKGQTRV